MSAEDPPWIAAAKGKLLCFAPNSEEKTCHEIDLIEKLADGTFRISSEYLASEEPRVVQKWSGSITIEGTKACSDITREVLASARFLEDGVELSATEAQPFLDAHIQKFTPLIDHRFCLDLTGDDPLFIVEFSIDGKALPSATTRMRLVAPEDGYRLRPLN